MRNLSDLMYFISFSGNDCVDNAAGEEVFFQMQIVLLYEMHKKYQTNKPVAVLLKNFTFPTYL